MQWCKQAALAKHITDGAASAEGVKREEGGPGGSSCDGIQCLSHEGTFHPELLTPEPLSDHM